MSEFLHQRLPDRGLKRFLAGIAIGVLLRIDLSDAQVRV
jgi:hypothetical protein